MRAQRNGETPQPPLETRHISHHAGLIEQETGRYQVLNPTADISDILVSRGIVFVGIIHQVYPFHPVR